MIPASFSDEALFAGTERVNPQVVRNLWKGDDGLSEKDCAELVERGFRYWRSKGFPYITKDGDQLKRAVGRLARFNVDRLLHQGNEIGQVNVGVDVCNSYHPKMFHVRCNKAKRSVFDAFNDDRLLKRSIGKAFQTTGVCTAAALRSMLRTGGTQMPSNFNPAIAKWIYTNFCPRDGYILDPSSGWGGRALGAITSPNTHYLGIDPHVAAIEANRQMIRDILGFPSNRTQEGTDFGEVNSTVDFKIACAEAPDGIPSLPGDHYDCIFTSPPYFDVEQYDDDPNQSYLKHGADGYTGWVKGFLEPLIRECSRVLKPGGWCLFNVSGAIRKKHNFAEDTLRLGKKHMEHVYTYQLRFALRTQLRKAGKRHRLEPLFLFQKKGIGERGFPTYDRHPFEKQDDLKLFQ